MCGGRWRRWHGKQQIFHKNVQDVFKLQNTPTFPKFRETICADQVTVLLHTKSEHFTLSLSDNDNQACEMFQIKLISHFTHALFDSKVFPPRILLWQQTDGGQRCLHCPELMAVKTPTLSSKESDQLMVVKTPTLSIKDSDQLMAVKTPTLSSKDSDQLMVVKTPTLSSKDSDQLMAVKTPTLSSLTAQQQ